MQEDAAIQTRTQRKHILALVLVLTAVTALGIAQFGWWRYLTIAFHLSIAEGTVLTTDCRNRNHVSYSFPADGDVIEGKDNWIGCRNLQPGDRLLVSFSSTDPAQNVAGSAQARLFSETLSILVASILASIWIAYTLLSPAKQQMSRKQ